MVRDMLKFFEHEIGYVDLALEEARSSDIVDSGIDDDVGVKNLDSRSFGRGAVLIPRKHLLHRLEYVNREAEKAEHDANDAERQPAGGRPHRTDHHKERERGEETE